MEISAYARHDRVIIKPIEIVEETIGRIITSDLGKEKANQYEVIAIGPGILNPFTGQFSPTQYTVGEIVFVHKVHIHTIDVDGEDFFVTRDSEILCGIKQTVNDTDNYDDNLPF